MRTTWPTRGVPCICAQCGVTEQLQRLRVRVVDTGGANVTVLTEISHGPSTACIPSGAAECDFVFASPQVGEHVVQVRRYPLCCPTCFLMRDLSPK